MGFKIHTTDDNRIPGIEYLECGAIALEIGTALTMSNGVLAVAGGTTKPTYLSMCERETATSGIIPVVRIQPDMILETTFSVAATNVRTGNKVTVSTDGKQVTATTEGGIAEIVTIDTNVAGGICRVRFP